MTNSVARQPEPLRKHSHRISGKERDSESRNDYFGARYYSSSTGRFLNPDPLGDQVADSAIPQSWNLYAYAVNNPFKYVDPTGTDWCAWDDGTHDDAPENGGANYQDCVKQGGTWEPDLQESVTVFANAGLTQPPFISYVWNAPHAQSPFQIPTNAPNNQDRLHCAAQFANQFSIAGITGLDNYHGFGSTFLNAALGNTFSGFVDAFDASTGQNGKSGFDLYPMGAAGGPLLGIPLPDGASPGLQGPLNTALAPAINAATTTSVTTLAGETAIGDSMAFPLAAAKFALDGLMFAAGYIGCHP